MSRTIPAECVDAFFRFFSDGEYDDSPVYPTVHDLTEGNSARSNRGCSRTSSVSGK